MALAIDYFYPPISGYAYLGEPRLREIAAKAGATIWRGDWALPISRSTMSTKTSHIDGPIGNRGVIDVAPEMRSPISHERPYGHRGQSRAR